MNRKLNDPLNGWGGRLLLSDGYVAYAGAGAAAERHAHHAIQLVWGLGDDIEIGTDLGTFVVGAALISSNTVHSLSGSATQILVILVEPTGPRGRLLESIACNLSGLDFSQHLPAVGLMPPADTDAEALQVWCDDLLARVLTAEGGGLPERPDPRPEVTCALDYIDDALPEVPRLVQAADKAAISPSRLTHLFTEQIGMPFRRYVLWRRIRLVTEQVQAGWNLTRAAAEAGFADSAHFSRTFHAMFGLAPSAILPHLEFINNTEPW